MKQTRFAPSPTGFLHLGHAYSALQCWEWAQKHGSSLILRIEDIDHTRCKDEYVESIYEDLRWLGLDWVKPVRIQSHHQADYHLAIEKLVDLGVLYPCVCSRKDIERALSAPHIEDRSVYPGTCRKMPPITNPTSDYSLRLDVEKALKITGPLTWHDEAAGLIEASPMMLGDVVIARKDIATSYHLSVVVDDALQGIETVIRGKDLFDVTHIHRLLQALLDLPVPLYKHHDLIVDATGERLAKRSGGRLIRSLREVNEKPQDIFKHIHILSNENTHS